MSAKSSRPQPGWYVATSTDDKNRKYIVVVPSSSSCPSVAIYTDQSFVATFAYPDELIGDFPWHEEYTLEKL